MLFKVLNYFGSKIIDEIFDKNVSKISDAHEREQLIQYYRDLKSEVKSRLIENNKEEFYFENLQNLLENTKIIEIIIAQSYEVNTLSIKKRKELIFEHISNHLNNIEIYELSRIKKEIYKEFSYCKEKVNKLDERDRKILYRLNIELLNQYEIQQEKLNYLSSDTNDIKNNIEELKQNLFNIELDKEALKDLTIQSIQNLGGRYDKEFNVDVGVTTVLSDYFIQNETIEKISKLLENIKKELLNDKRDSVTVLIKKIETLNSDIQRHKVFDYSLLLPDIDYYLDELENKNKEKYSENSSELYKSSEYNYWRRLCILKSDLQTCRERIEKRVLIITGDAGIGKSHSITHFLYNKYYQTSKLSVFLLGQYFRENKSPILIIEEYLHVSKLQEFLEQLNKVGESENYIVPFVIEGINEGAYSEIWRNDFLGLMTFFEQFQYIKLVLSIRSTYIRKCLPEGIFSNDKVLMKEHQGFSTNPIEAISLFFDYYDIDKPTFPVLYLDFYNPLFLHTLCKTIKGLSIIKMQDYSSFSLIFDKYLEKVNNEVSLRCNYMPSLKLVQKSVMEVVKYSVDNGMKYGIPIHDFFKEINSVISMYGVPLIEYVNALIEQGIFYREVHHRGDEEYIQFAYERYHNIITAKYLTSKITSQEELIKLFEKEDLIKHPNLVNGGVLEELAILLPEKYGVEIFDIFKDDNHRELIDPFLNSLIWRKKENFNIEKIKHHVNHQVIISDYYFKKFITTLFIVAPIENHPLNCNFLHDYLVDQSMANRDSYLVEVIYEECNFEEGILSILISLCKNQISLYSEATKKLMIMFLAWTMAGTNLKYRENVIWTLVKLMENNLSLAAFSLKKFNDVDDMYIKEGLYCSIYGALLRSKNLDGAEELGEEVLEDIFNRKEVYPHIIVRSHGKEIIDFLRNKGLMISMDYSKVVPPYNSKWYDDIPSNEDLKKYSSDRQEKSKNPNLYSADTIISSMATNAGSSPGMYGDFGRYVFEGWVEPWKYHFEAQELSNIVVKQIFEKYKYDWNSHGEFDRRIQPHSRQQSINERIGKKYQRISSFEMLARLSDNFEIGEVNREYLNNTVDYEEEDFLTWIESVEFREVEYIEKFIPYKYLGPWQFHYRGIDPTLIPHSELDSKSPWKREVFIPDISNNLWASDDSINPDIHNLLFGKYDGKEFVTLEMYNNWKIKTISTEKKAKEYFLKAIAVLVPRNADFLNNKKIRQLTQGDNNPELNDVFSREVCWSNAFREFENILKKYESEDPDKGYIATGMSYSSPISYLTENIITAYSMPSKYIIEELQLEQLDDGKWYNKQGNLICLDLKFEGFQGELVIRKESLYNLMKKNDLTLVWGMYSEKQGYPYFYATRQVAWWDGDNLSVKQFDTEQWKTHF